jgi:hypothetical protein
VTIVRCLFTNDGVLQQYGLKVVAAIERNSVLPSSLWNLKSRASDRNISPIHVLTDTQSVCMKGNKKAISNKHVITLFLSGMPCRRFLRASGFGLLIRSL